MFRNWITNAAMIFLWAAGGCNTYKSMQVFVRDAETGMPIASATVGVEYLSVLDLFPPSNAGALTDEQGHATLRIATNALRRASASAEGFIPYSSIVPNEKLDFWLYRLPKPSVEIIVPLGYRGGLQIRLNPTASLIQERPGKRDFVFRASSRGFVQIDAAPLLRDAAFDPDRLLVVRCEDGRQIPEGDYHVGPEDVALRWVSAGGDEILYVIGTAADQRQMRH